MRLSAVGDRFAVADVGPQRADRPPRLDHVRPRQVDRRLDLLREAGPAPHRCRAAPPAAASGSRRSPARGCRGCRAPAGCAPREWPCAVLRRGCCSITRLKWSASAAWRAIASVSTVRHHRAPSQSGSLPVASLNQPSVRPPIASGATTMPCTPLSGENVTQQFSAAARRRANIRSSARQPGLYANEVLGQRLVREGQRLEIAVPLRVQPIVHVGEPQRAALGLSRRSARRCSRGCRSLRPCSS